METVRKGGSLPRLAGRWIISDRREIGNVGNLFYWDFISVGKIGSFTNIFYVLFVWTVYRTLKEKFNDTNQFFLP